MNHYGIYNVADIMPGLDSCFDGFGTRPADKTVPAVSGDNFRPVFENRLDMRDRWGNSIDKFFFINFFSDFAIPLKEFYCQPSLTIFLGKFVLLGVNQRFNLS